MTEHHARRKIKSKGNKEVQFVRGSKINMTNDTAGNT
jgi:hypothetical protein